MTGIFKLLRAEGEQAGEGPAVALGIDLRIGERRVHCPVSEVCRSQGQLAREVEALKAALDRLLGEAADSFGKSGSHEDPAIPADMKAQDAWALLLAIPEEGRFTAVFNSLDERKRREIAEHVLTHCNVFAGRGAGFSANFNSDTALLE